MTDVVLDKEYIAAIDLGSKNIVTVVGLKDKEGNVEILGSTVTPSEGMENGTVRNVESMAISIKQNVEQLEQQLGVRVEAVYAGVSGRYIKSVRHSYFVFVSNRDGEVRFDDVKKINESMDNIQVGERERVLDRIPQHYIIDNRADEMITNPVGMFGHKLENSFIFVVGENSVISRIENALGRVGLKQTSLFVNPLVAAEAVLMPEEKNEGVMFMDIGAGTTDICIYKDNIARHVVSLPIGGAMINKDIQSYGLMAKYVETLKVGHGSAVSKLASTDHLIRIKGVAAGDEKIISAQNLSVIIESRLLDIVELAMNELKRSGYDGKLRAGIVITGGVSLTKDIDILFKEHTKMAVRVATPVINLVKEGSEIVDDPIYSTAIGILLRGAKGNTSSMVNAPVSEIKDDIVDELPEPSKRKKKQGGGLFSKIKKSFDKMLTDIDDNVI
ncbi:MAG: cell division protein FtsA [Rikenellaceae bacterium]